MGMKVVTILCGLRIMRNFGKENRLNIERDAKNHALLAKLGWNVIVVWECELKRSTAEETLNLLVHCIVQRQSYGNSN